MNTVLDSLSSLCYTAKLDDFIWLRLTHVCQVIIISQI